MSELSNALVEMPITAECKFIKFEPGPAKVDGLSNYDHSFGTYHWLVTLRLNGQSMTIPYSTGTGHCVEPGESHSYTYRGVSGFSRAPKGWRYDRSVDAVAFRKAWFADKRSARVPELADVVGCLLSSSSGAEQAFEQWASDLGYDTDSRKAYDTWQACRNEQLGLRVLFGSDYDRLLGLEH